MSSGKKFIVAICGAGIGGLTLAVGLSRYPDIEVQIFEAAEKLAEIGAGIGLFSRPWEVVQKLDLEEDLLKLTELRRTEDLGISRGHILGIATTDSLSSLSVFLSLP